VLRVRSSGELMGDRKGGDGGGEGRTGEEHPPLGRGRADEAGADVGSANPAPNDSRTSVSNSSGRSPSAFANSRRWIRSAPHSSWRSPASRTARSSSHRFHSRGGAVTTGSGSGGGRV